MSPAKHLIHWLSIDAGIAKEAATKRFWCAINWLFVANTLLAIPTAWYLPDFFRSVYR